jgi:hypothetical protein
VPGGDVVSGQGATGDVQSAGPDVGRLPLDLLRRHLQAVEADLDLLQVHLIGAHHLFDEVGEPLPHNGYQRWELALQRLDDVYQALARVAGQFLQDHPLGVELAHRWIQLRDLATHVRDVVARFGTSPVASIQARLNKVTAITASTVADLSLQLVAWLQTDSAQTAVPAPADVLHALHQVTNTSREIAAAALEPVEGILESAKTTAVVVQLVPTSTPVTVRSSTPATSPSSPGPGAGDPQPRLVWRGSPKGGPLGGPQLRDRAMTRQEAIDFMTSPNSRNEILPGTDPTVIRYRTPAGSEVTYKGSDPDTAQSDLGRGQALTERPEWESIRPRARRAVAARPLRSLQPPPATEQAPPRPVRR